VKKSRYPYQYEEEASQHGYTEPGSDGSAHLDTSDLDNPALKRLLEATADMTVPDTLKWINSNLGQGEVKDAVVFDGADGAQLAESGIADEKASLLVLTMGLNAVKELNILLNRSSESLPEKGYIWVHTNTSGIRKMSVMRCNPPVIRNIVYFFWYFWYRVFPKLRMTRWLYRLHERFSGKVNRCYHRVEVLGRLYRAGFEVVDEQFNHGHFYVVGRKVKAPIWEDEPTGSPIIKLHRVGKGGKLIPVFKFRTMHSYSEYLQGYIYRYNSLDKSGKFADDYRVAGYGKLLRKFWLDELPMVFNLLRGDVKLVGVRPISRQYYSLYSSAMQELRIKVKPGLLPPFYYELKRPEGIEEVQESERRYIEAYLKHPFKTDWRYFWGTVGNILFRGVRSK